MTRLTKHAPISPRQLGGFIPGQRQVEVRNKLEPHTGLPAELRRRHDAGPACLRADEENVTVDAEAVVAPGGSRMTRWLFAFTLINRAPRTRRTEHARRSAGAIARSARRKHRFMAAASAFSNPFRATTAPIAVSSGTDVDRTKSRPTTRRRRRRMRRASTSSLRLAEGEGPRP